MLHLPSHVCNIAKIHKLSKANTGMDTVATFMVLILIPPKDLKHLAGCEAEMTMKDSTGTATFL